MFHDVPTFSRTCIFFLLIFSLLTLLTSAFQLSILSEVSLLNFLRSYTYHIHIIYVSYTYHIHIVHIDRYTELEHAGTPKRVSGGPTSWKNGIGSDLPFPWRHHFFRDIRGTHSTCCRGMVDDMRILAPLVYYGLIMFNSSGHLSKDSGPQICLRWSICICNWNRKTSRTKSLQFLHWRPKLWHHSSPRNSKTQRFLEVTTTYINYLILIYTYDILWYLMISDDILWYLMISYDILWYLVISYDILWYLMISYDILWYLMIFIHSLTLELPNWT